MTEKSSKGVRDKAALYNYSRGLTTRGSYNQGSYIQGSYNQGFLEPQVLPAGVFTTRGSYEQGSEIF